MTIQPGDRVHFVGSDRIPAGDGEVIRIYQGTFRALVRMNEKPVYWPYPTLEFAPLISDLEKIE